MILLTWKPFVILFIFAPEVYPKPIRKSKMKLFLENSYQLKAFNYFRNWLHRRCSTGFWIHLCIPVAMFKIDSRENILQDEICLKLVIKPPERNRKNKSITVNKNMVKFHNSNNWLWVCIFLLGKNGLEYFRIK